MSHATGHAAFRSIAVPFFVIAAVSSCSSEALRNPPPVAATSADAAGPAEAPLAGKRQDGPTSPGGSTTSAMYYSEGYPEPLVATLTVTTEGYLTGRVCGPDIGGVRDSNCGALDSAWPPGPTSHFDFTLPWPGGGEPITYSFVGSAFQPGIQSFSGLITGDPSDGGALTWRRCLAAGCPGDHAGDYAPLPQGVFRSSHFEDPFLLGIDHDGEGHLRGRVCGPGLRDSWDSCSLILQGRRRGRVVHFEYTLPLLGGGSTGRYVFDGVLGTSGGPLRGRLRIDYDSSQGSDGDHGLMWQPCSNIPSCMNFDQKWPVPRLSGTWRGYIQGDVLILSVAEQPREHGQFTGSACLGNACRRLSHATTHGRLVLVDTRTDPPQAGWVEVSAFATDSDRVLTGWAETAGGRAPIILRKDP